MSFLPLSPKTFTPSGPLGGILLSVDGLYEPGVMMMVMVGMVGCD